MDSDFYKSYYQAERNHWWSRVRAKIIFDLLTKYSKPGSKILDFGCGSGHLVSQLQNQGYDASGVDMSAQAIEAGKHEGIKNISILKWDDQQERQNDRFDVVLALDVVEHIEDDQRATNYLLNLLNPRGILIVTVPAYEFLWGVQDDISHHYRRYTKSRLANLFSPELKLEKLKSTYFNSLLFPAIAGFRLADNLFKTKRESDFSVNNNFSDKLFGGVFDFERKLLKYINFPFGVSVLLVLKKTA